MADKTAGRNAVNGAWNQLVSWLQWGSAHTVKALHDHTNVLRQLTRR